MERDGHLPAPKPVAQLKPGRYADLRQTRADVIFSTHRVQKLNRDTIPTDSATGVAMRDDTTTLGHVHQNGTVANAWFMGVVKRTYFDEMFVESAVRLASRGVLTLLEPCLFDHREAARPN